MDFFRIEIAYSEDPPELTYDPVWPTAERLVKGGEITQEEAEAEFARLSEIDNYLEFHKDTDGALYPLVLMKYDDQDASHLSGEELDRFAPGLIFDGEVFDSSDLDTTGRPPYTVSTGRREWYLFSTSESAGAAVAEYYRDMAANDEREFVCLIGETRLLQWALGNSDEFGISGAEDFFDRVADVPEEHWASYDGNEIEVDGASEEVIADLGFTPTVAYRHN